MFQIFQYCSLHIKRSSRKTRAICQILNSDFGYGTQNPCLCGPVLLCSQRVAGLIKDSFTEEGPSDCVSPVSVAHLGTPGWRSVTVFSRLEPELEELFGGQLGASSKKKPLSVRPSEPNSYEESRQNPEACPGNLWTLLEAGTGLTHLPDRGRKRVLLLCRHRSWGLRTKSMGHWEAFGSAEAHRSEPVHLALNFVPPVTSCVTVDRPVSLSRTRFSQL